MAHRRRSARLLWTPGLALLGFAAFAFIGVERTAAEGDTTPPVGTLLLYAGDPATNVTDISADTPATDDQSGVTTVELSNNGTAWQSFAYPGPGGWDISDPATGGTTAHGTHTVYARWTDGAGNVSAPVSASIIYDPVAPTLTLSFGPDGASATNDPNLTLYIGAADNVGVTLMEIAGPGGVHLSQAYSPTVAWDLGAAAPDGYYDFSVAVRDLAVNLTSVNASVFLDRTPPTFTRLNADAMAPGGTISFSISAGDMGEIPFARFSSNGGASWGAPVPIVGNQVEWNPLDATLGGSSALGRRTVHVQVRDTAGNWSSSRSAVVDVTASLSLDISANPTTGKPITFSLDWDSPVTLPSGAMCLWEFMWGDDASIYLAERNETFGSVMTQGAASAGFCDRWTFTLPWTPVRQYLVSVRVMASDWTILGGVMLGSSPDEVAFTSGVGSTSRHITTTNLPMFYVLPEDYELKRGEPAVYRAYAIGGATIRSSDAWTIVYENVPERHPGSAVLTFYPKTTGYITVCLARDYHYPTQLGACFDPPVRSGSGSSGGGSGSGSGASSSPAAESPEPGPSGTAGSSASGLTPSATPGSIAAVDSSPDPGAMPAGSMPTVQIRERTALGWVFVAIVLGAAFGGLALLHPGLRRRVLRLLERARLRGGRAG